MRQENHKSKLIPVPETSGEGALPKEGAIFDQLGSISPFALKQRESGVPTITKPAPIEKPSTQEKLKKKRLGGLIFRFGATTLFLSTALGSGVAAYNHHTQENESLNLGGVRNDIAAIPEELADLYGAIFDPTAIVEENKKAMEFDNEAVEQKVIAGPNGNAQPATEDQIREFLKQIPPVIEKPKPGESTPRIQVLLPVNPENAKLKVVKGPNNWQEFHIEGSNKSFHLPLIPGAEKVEARKNVHTNAGGEEEFTHDILLRYYLSNGQRVDLDIAFWDKNFIPTKIMKNLPSSDPNRIENQSRDSLPTKNFDLAQDTNIDLFHVSGSTKISVLFMVPRATRTSESNPIRLQPFFKQTPNGKILHLLSSSD